MSEAPGIALSVSSPPDKMGLESGPWSLLTVSSSASGADSGKEGVHVSRLPGQLRPHRVLDEIGWTDLDELNEAARRKLQKCSGAHPDHKERDYSLRSWFLAASAFRG